MQRGLPSSFLATRRTMLSSRSPGLLAASGPRAVRHAGVGPAELCEGSGRRAPCADMGAIARRSAFRIFLACLLNEPRASLERIQQLVSLPGHPGQTGYCRPCLVNDLEARPRSVLAARLAGPVHRLVRNSSDAPDADRRGRVAPAHDDVKHQRVHGVAADSAAGAGRSEQYGVAAGRFDHAARGVAPIRPHSWRCWLLQASGLAPTRRPHRPRSARGIATPKADRHAAEPLRLARSRS